MKRTCIVAALTVVLFGVACGGNNPNEKASRASAPAGQGKIDGPLSIDLERADPETKARVSGNAFADLPPEAAMALRARMDRLVPLWSEYKKLVAVAG
jgi:hypothetical protein